MSADFDFLELKAAGCLPSPAGTALHIMQLVQQDEAGVPELAEIVKTDPALTSRILSFANSAAFGARRPIVSVNEAVQMMGMQAVRNFALGLSLVSNNLKGSCANFDYGAYWMKSLAMAVAIASVTSRERTVAPEEGFTLGLLSEIGQLALATSWPERYSACLHASGGYDLLNLENECFAIDHRALTILLLKDWGLPEVFLDALKFSFDLPKAEISRMVGFANQLFFARKIASFCVADDAHRRDLLTELEQLAATHNFDSETLAEFLLEVEGQWRIWGRLINVNTDQRLSTSELKNEKSEPVSGLSKLPGLNILLVDDDPAVLAQLAEQLTEAGHQVEYCTDGEAALKRVLEHKFQLLIIDCKLEPMDGLKLCKTLRSAEIGRKLYIIVLSDAGSEDELLEAYDAGIDDFVVKPINLKILLARIRAGQRINALQQELEKEKQDIQRYNSELALANRRLSIMANTDALTGLSNRRYALTRLKQEWDAAQRYNRPLSVLMLDLDYFKAINDNLGHEAGDVVLAHAAKLMKTAARVTDVVCRFGGEEFLIIATNTDGNTALALAERIRRIIQSQQPRGLALPRTVTVSIGVAGCKGKKLRWDELIRLADKALYLAKANGRDASRLAEF